MRLTLLSVALAYAGTASAIPSSQSFPRSPSEIRSIDAACRQLSAQFPNDLFFPNSSNYTAEQTAYWSETTVLTPNCVFRPANAAAVSAGLKIVSKNNSPFAVRSGGHMPVPGAASTDDGVLFAMSAINTKKLVNNNVAQLGPGQSWLTVYSWLSQYDLAVAGGRYAPVGVGGYLLGGGISYFGSEVGWGANNLVNVEVVLADGRIVNANATSNPDLFWALKGGSNNFGIVTRFDIKTFSVPHVYGGNLAYDHTQVSELVDATASFVAPGGGSDDNNAAIVPVVAISPATGAISGSLTMCYRGSDPNPAALANFTKIQAQSSDAGLRTFSDFMTLSSSQGTRGLRWLFRNTGVKVIPGSISLINETFTDYTLSNIKNIESVKGATVMTSIQPITVNWLKAAKAAGGEPIGLDPANGAFIASLVICQWDDASDDDTMNAYATGVVDAIAAAAKKAGADYPFVYLNDAAKGQEVFKYYGGGTSLAKLKAIQRTYDPNGVFKRLEASGFKL